MCIRDRYYYKLVPLDKDWIRAASNQNISYSKLPPGDYILQVRATNSAKEGPYATRSLSIVIQMCIRDRDKTTQISPSEPFITTFAAEGLKEGNSRDKHCVLKQ